MSWTEFLTNLSLNVPLAQLSAYTTLTLTSIIVATVSLRFSYRQNFGWRPLLIVSTHGMESPFGPDADPDKVLAVVEFEVWNRHTYPLIIDGVDVKFRQDILADSESRVDNENPWWVSDKSHCSYMERLVVKNGEHQSFRLSLPMKKGQSLDVIDDLIDIHVLCFDPRRERKYKIKQKYHYHFKSRSQLRKPVHKWIRQLLGIEYNGSTSRGVTR